MRTLVLLFTLIFGNVWAAENVHYFPNDDATSLKSSISEQNFKYPGYCEIEIVNNSNYTVIVSGVFSDGSDLIPFRIYPFEYPHYISLYYYGWCHYGMDIYIQTLDGYRVYSGYTRRYDSIYITSDSYASNPAASVKLQSKSSSK